MTFPQTVDASANEVDLSAEASYLVDAHAHFMPLVTEVLDNTEFIPAPFDDILNEVLDKTITGEITRLLVNIPPGYGKSLRGVWGYVSRGFAINPESRFIHTSYSDKLVLDNSVKIKKIIESDVYSSLFPYVNFQEDSKAKGLWTTSYGGHFLASASGGAITGFRAGHINREGFSGAFIVDDPLKPDDARSDVVREGINKRYKETFASRLAVPRIPFIVFMQRLHPRDFTQAVLEEDEGNWHHLILPAYIPKTYVYTQSGIHVPFDLPEGSLWQLKADDELAKKLSERNIQYSQEPTEEKGEIFEREWFGRYQLDDDLPRFKRYVVIADTATKVEKKHDETCFQLWGLSTRNTGYLLQIKACKVTVPQLTPAFEAFYDGCCALVAQLTRQQAIKGIPVYIEDANSGSGLIQTLATKKNGRGRAKYRVNPITRKVSKTARAMTASDKLCGDVILFLPHTKDGDAVLNQVVGMKEDESQPHDDLADPLVDFVNMFIPSSKAIHALSGLYRKRA